MAKALIINELIDKLGLKLYRFEQEIGIGNTTLKKAIDRDSDLSIEIIEKIVSRYPYVNSQWLLTGEGEMLDEEKQFEDEKKRFELKAAQVKASVENRPRYTSTDIEDMFRRAFADRNLNSDQDLVRHAHVGDLESVIAMQQQNMETMQRTMDSLNGLVDHLLGQLKEYGEENKNLRAELEKISRELGKGQE